MARVFDQISKQWIDDGLPENPVTGDAPLPGVEMPAAEGVPAMPSVGPEDVQQGPTGAAGQAAAASPIPAQTVFVASPKPEHERQISTQQAAKGKDTLAAEAKLTEAQAKVDAAQPLLTAEEAKEDRVTATAAAETVQAKRDEIERARLAEETRKKNVAERLRQDQELIEEEKRAEKESGNGHKSYWDGRPAAAIFTRILQAVGGALHSAAGKSGEDPVTRTLNSYMAAHEKRLKSVYEATKNANDAKREGFEKDEAEEIRQEIVAANQSMKQIDLIGEELKASIASLSPEKRKAAQALADAKLAESRAELARQAASKYDRLGKVEETQRSGGAANAQATKPPSDDTRTLAVGKDMYATLAAKNRAIIERNGGEVPITGEDAQEFETNDKAMAAILQKPLGKSDEDAKTARNLQATPGVWEKLRQEVGGSKQPVKNYLRALEVNGKRLQEEASAAAAAEGKTLPGAPAVQPAAAPVAPVQPAPKSEPVHPAFKGKTDQEIIKWHTKSMMDPKKKRHTEALRAELKRRGL